MALTPDDIVNHEFRQTMRGYAVTEVDDLLDRLADQVERNERDLAELRRRLEADAGKLAEAQRNETALTQTLVTAQQTAQRIVQDAEERAAIIVADAETQAAELTAEAARTAEAVTADAREAAEHMRAETDGERVALRERLEQLVAVERTHRDELRAHLERQLAAIDQRDDGPAAAVLDQGDPAVIDDGGDRPGAEDLAGTDIAERGWGDLLDAARDGDSDADADHHDGHADHADGHTDDGHTDDGHTDHHDGGDDHDRAGEQHAHGG